MTDTAQNQIGCKPTALLALLVSALCLGGAIALGYRAGMLGVGVGGLGLLAVSLLAGQWPASGFWLTAPGTRLRNAWAGTIMGLATLLLMYWAWNAKFAAVAWLAAAAVFFGGGLSAADRVRWRALAMTWAFSGGGIWLAAGYQQNLRGAFYAGVAVNVLLLLLCRRWFALRMLGIQAVNTLVLLGVGLSLADVVVRHVAARAADPRQKYYLYANGGRHPYAFGQWKRSFYEQYDQLAREIVPPKLRGTVSFRLRPDTHTTFFGNRVDINNRGFRGRDLPAEKGNTYRIIALGESTTFGLGLTPQDRIWPALLEQMIRERLRPARPVAVINAGIPGYDLKQNLTRLEREILPLRPDLLISYHGINGFHLISEALPRTYAQNPPVFRERPFELLAEIEYGLRVSRFKRRYLAESAGTPPVLSNPLTTEYADLYRELIGIAHTNGFRLVLATHSMAANARSDAGVVEFYRRSFPAVEWQIKGNEAHNAIVQQLAAEHPEVTLVDTRPHLDGEHDKFIDLVHFAPEGDEQMAETMFAGIRAVLEKDLGISR